MYPIYNTQRRTSANINQELFPVQQWAMGGEAVNWQREIYVNTHSRAVDMQSLAHVKDFVWPYVLGGLVSMAAQLGARATATEDRSSHKCQGLVAAVAILQFRIDQVERRCFV